jgi:heptosyltransferase-2
MKIVLLELWGLGDAVMMTTVLRPLLAAGCSVTVVCKPGSAELLRPTYPSATYILFDAPWTVFRGKYRLWRWPWARLLRLIPELRRGKFNAAASVRNDPRDHLLMFLTGAKNRIGIPGKIGGWLLNRPLVVQSMLDHRVDFWRQIGKALGQILSAAGLSYSSAETDSPRLDPAAYPEREAAGKKLGGGDVPGGAAPVVGLHCGARISVRRWKEEYFRSILEALRQDARFHLALFPDIDGYGRGLAPLADSCHDAISIPQLAADLAACDLIICNDSGPGHIAAALGVPVLAIFGPTNPDWFRPFGPQHHVVIRDICPFRPCFDYCRFSQPVCLTELTPGEVEPEIRFWFRQRLESLSPSHP